MTIARRLILLLAVPLAALLGLGVFVRIQLSQVESQTRFVSEAQIPSLAVLGNLSRMAEGLRVTVRSYLLATNEADRAKCQVEFEADEAEMTRFLGRYGDTLVTGDKDRRLLDDYRESSRDYVAAARQVMKLAAEGRRAEALALLNGPAREVSQRLSGASTGWIQHNETLADSAGKAAVEAITGSRWKMLIANSAAFLFTGALGFLTFRRIVNPIRALETSVKAIAAGDYAKEVPFTQATDETGGLARSVDVLKRGSAAMEAQRWVKANVSKVTGELQGATSVQEFGERLLADLVPMLGGGVAGFYIFEEHPGCLKRVAGYGLTEGAGASSAVEPGEGLIGQCARERKSVTLAHLPADYLRISSGLGAGVPAQTMALPFLCGDTLLGVVELATFRAFNTQEQALLTELLPVVALSLQVLLRNLRTQELLGQTQAQARQLEEQTEQLTQSQEELLAQKEELLAQQQELTRQREQLQISEERSRLILESSAEGIFGVDTEGCITFVNPAACRMLGFSAEELLGQASHSTFHHHRPDGREYPKEECPMFAAYKHGRASRIDDEFLWCKDGAGLPVEYGATPMRKDGAVVGAVISFTDITERKRAEAELQHSHFLADGALELTRTGYWHVPLDGSGRYNSSERAARIFGDPPAADHRYSLAHWAEHVRLGDEAAARVTAENFQAAVEGKIPVYDAIYAYKRPLD